MYPNSTLKRFWNKVKVGTPDECWEWQASKSKHGYGRFCVKKPKIDVAHRVSWTIANGPIIDGLFVLHTCDNPPCVNPKHLWLGTQADNIRDAVNKGRIRNGEAVNLTKLTRRDVLEIRRLYATGKVTQAILGKMFRTYSGNCSRIINHKSWKHVP